MGRRQTQRRGCLGFHRQGANADWLKMNIKARDLLVEEEEFQTCGVSDGIGPPERARKDVPHAQIHVLDAGHFRTGYGCR